MVFEVKDLLEANAKPAKPSGSQLTRPPPGDGFLVLDFGHVAASGGSVANSGVAWLKCPSQGAEV